MQETKIIQSTHIIVMKYISNTRNPSQKKKKIMWKLIEEEENRVGKKKRIERADQNVDAGGKPDRNQLSIITSSNAFDSSSVT